jgi:ATP-binding cassette subfamily C (CFTR/MRP) protein 4
MRVAERTDYRIRLLSDMLNGIRAIKMFAWEKHFARLVNAARRYVPAWGPPKNYKFFSDLK